MSTIIRSLIASLCLYGVASAQMGSQLTPVASATDTAVVSGSWQEPTTWKDGTVPVAGERVLIPAGVTVTNHATTADVLWIHVAGTLKVCEHCDTQINVHTIYVPMGGAFRVGHAGMPVTAKAVVEFAIGQPFPVGKPYLPNDWQTLSLGLIVHGEFTAAGTEKTAWDVVSDSKLEIGATSLTLANVPYGWKPGDRILIAGTDSIQGEDTTKHVYQSEEATIVGVSGRTVTFMPALKYKHFRWRPDLPFHCGNLTRNVIFRSRSPAPVSSRGHCMFMSPAVDLRYATFLNLGRTDKSKPVTDPRNDEYGEFIPGTADNTRARYSVHAHRVGVHQPPQLWKGCVVDGSPGWGFLNHASNVVMEDDIGIRCFGFAFGTEEGQERGAMRRCLAALNRGQGDTIASTDEDHGILSLGDWGKDGSGFWLQGGLVDVSDDVAFDNSGRGFALFNQPLNSYPDFVGPKIAPWLQGTKIEHAAYLLPDDYKTVDWWTKATTKPVAIPSGYVPQRVFNRNTAYQCKVGFQGWNNQTNTNHVAEFWPLSVRGQITDLTLWGRGSVCHLEYTRQFDFDGVKVIGMGKIRPNHADAQKAGMILRAPEITVKRYEVVGRAPPVEYLDLANKPTQKVN